MMVHALGSSHPDAVRSGGLAVRAATIAVGGVAVVTYLAGIEGGVTALGAYLETPTVESADVGRRRYQLTVSVQLPARGLADEGRQRLRRLMQSRRRSADTESA